MAIPIAARSAPYDSSSRISKAAGHYVLREQLKEIVGHPLSDHAEVHGLSHT